jgi:hypothetical protein
VLPLAFNPFLCQLVHPPIERRSELIVAAAQLKWITIFDGREFGSPPPSSLDEELRRGDPLRHRGDSPIRQRPAIHDVSQEPDSGFAVITEQLTGDAS